MWRQPPGRTRDPIIEKATDSEFVELGWQDRLRDRLDRNNNAEEHIEDYRWMISDAVSRHGQVLVVQGDIEDTIFLSEAADRFVTTARGREPRSRNVAVATQTVDAAIGASHAISALHDGSQSLGSYVGYATGQGKNLDAGAKISTSATGNAARHALEGRVNATHVGAIIIDGADQDTVNNHLLMGALKLQQERGDLPVTILVSRRVDRAETLANFFSTYPVDQTFFKNRPEGNKLPTDIRYEEAKEPWHIPLEQRVAEIINQIISGQVPLDSNAIAFLRNEDMARTVLRQIRRAIVGYSELDTKTGVLEGTAHRLIVLTQDTKLETFLRRELSAPENTFRGSKPTIILTTHPVDMIGVTMDFSLVIDSARDRMGGGYFAVSPGESERRARLAGPDGICFRLTTQEASESGRTALEASASYSLSPRDREQFNFQLSRAGHNAQEFPSLNDALGADDWGESSWPDDDVSEPIYTSEVSPRREPQPLASWPAYEPPAPEPPKELTPTERLAQRLDVSESTARVFQALEAVGKKDLAYAVAAVSRESRIVQTEHSAREKAVKRFGTRSDILLRVRALLAHRNENLEDHGINQASLGHVEAILARYGQSFGDWIDPEVMTDQLRDLSDHELAKLLAQSNPELFAYRQEGYGYGGDELRYSMSTAYRRIGKNSVADFTLYRFDDYEDGPWSPPFQRKQFTESDRARLTEPFNFGFVISSGGPNGDFADTIHPVTVSEAIELMPDKVRRSFGEPKLDGRGGVYRSVTVSAKRLQRSGWGSWGNEPDTEDWDVVEELQEEVRGQVADDMIAAEVRRVEQEKQVEAARLERWQAGSGELRGRLERVAIILEQVVGQSPSSTTAASARLADVRKLLEVTNGPAGRQSLEQITTEVERHELRTATLVRKVSKETGWQPDWPEHFNNLFEQIPALVSTDDFAREFIESDEVTAVQISDWIKDNILSSHLPAIQKGNSVDIAKLIEAAVEQLVG